MALSARIIHLADIHIRDGEIEHNKFVAALREVDAYLRDSPSARDKVPQVAVIAGDIFHYKTRLSGENIADFFALLNMLAPHARAIIIIPGNHDANLNNGTRLDLITPLMENCAPLDRLHRNHNTTIHYWSRNGWYNLDCLPNIAFYVFSPLCVAEEPHMDAIGTKQSVAILHDFIDEMRIHGAVIHSTIKQEWLREFSAVMCGHIHDYFDDGHIVYPGALTQLTIGESFDKGFVMWEFATAGDSAEKNAPIHHTFIPLREVPGAMVKYVVTKGAAANTTRTKMNVLGANVPFPFKPSRISIELKSGVSADHPDALALKADVENKMRDMDGGCAMEIISSANERTREISHNASADHLSETHHELIERKLRATFVGIDDATIATIFALHAEAIQQAQGNVPKVNEWRLLSLAWDNMFCYESGNFINFENVAGFAGIIAPNRCGKSSVIDILALALFNVAIRGTSSSVIHCGCRNSSLSCAWESGGHRHQITRQWVLKRTTTDLEYTIDGVNHTGKDLRETYEIIAQSVGTFDDFIAAVAILQHGDESFIDMSDAKKRAILSRILGFDILESALEYVRQKERDSSSECRVFDARVSASVKRMRIADAEGSESAETPIDDARISAIASSNAEKSAIAQKLVSDLRGSLKNIESLPAAVKPSQSSAELRSDVVEQEKLLPNIDATISVKEQDVAIARRSEDTGSEHLASTDAPSLAMISDYQAHIDQSMLAIGHTPEFAQLIKPDAMRQSIAKITDAISHLGEIIKVSTERAAAQSFIDEIIGLMKSVAGDAQRPASAFAKRAFGAYEQLAIAQNRSRALISDKEDIAALAGAQSHVRDLMAVFDLDALHASESGTILDNLDAHVNETNAKKSALIDARAAQNAVQSFASMLARAHCKNISELPERLATAMKIKSHLADLAELEKAEATVAQFAKMMARAKCETVDDIHEKLAKLDAERHALDEMDRIDDAIRALGPITTPRAGMVCPSGIEPHQSLSEIVGALLRERAKLEKFMSEDLSRADWLRALSGSMNCTCEFVPLRAKQFRDQLESLECATFAPDLAVPKDIAALTERDAGAHIAKCLASLSAGGQIAPKTKRGNATEIIYCALRIMRNIGGTGDFVLEEKAMVKKCMNARFCVAHHEEIAAFRDIKARIEYLENARMIHLKTQYDALMTERKTFAPLAWTLCPSDGANESAEDDVRAAMDELRAIESAIRAAFEKRDALCQRCDKFDEDFSEKLPSMTQCENMISALEELRENEGKIRDAIKARDVAFGNKMITMHTSRSPLNIDGEIAQCEYLLHTLSEIRKSSPAIRAAVNARDEIAKRMKSKGIAESSGTPEISRIDDELRAIAKKIAILESVIAKERAIDENRDRLAHIEKSPIVAHIVPLVRIADVKNKLFAHERELERLRDISGKIPKIKEALEQYEKLSTMRRKYDTKQKLDHDKIVLQQCLRELEQCIEARDDIRATIKSLNARIVSVIAQEKLWKEFTERTKEIETLRNDLARAQDAERECALNTSIFEDARREWQNAVGVLHTASIHKKIYAMYRSALDAKTGVQHELMQEAIKIIETEVNRMLDPIAGLRLSISVGDARAFGTTVSEDKILMRGGTMQITVRDTRSSNGVEHSADLCSGFQRFIINIAVRHAFLRSAVRPMPRFIIIDEGFGCIDDVNVAKVCEYLPELAQELDFMIIISHTDALNALITIPIVINTTIKDDGKSRVSSLKYGEPVAIGAIASVPRPKAPRVPKVKRTSVAPEAPATSSPVAPTEAPSTSSRVLSEPKRAPKTRIKIDDSFETRGDGLFFCKLCEKEVKNWRGHVKSAKHVANSLH